MEPQRSLAGEDAYRFLMDALVEINGLKDVDAILDRLLLSTRCLTGADAGSIFLVEDEKLKFSYVQNDTLFKADAVNKEIYLDFAVPMDTHSIVGYAAVTGEIVRVEDAYAIASDSPFQFNPAWDAKSGYRTGSILALPLRSVQNQTIGVIQLINAKDGGGRVVPFAEEQLRWLSLFGVNACMAIERGQMTRELVLRMMKMAELRDPTETGSHVQRVGSYAAAIYHQWALDHTIANDERRKHKDLIRVAAMLHDVGKVGISDLILKKPGKLTEEEFAIMKGHPVLGAKLFAHATAELDVMALEIALNHHERWDGRGYPGHVIGDIHNDTWTLGPGKNGTEAPLMARITSLADVYDALCSKRVYKEAWSEEQVLDHIQQQAGQQFDPEVVEAFMKVADFFPSIRAKYQEHADHGGASLEGKLMQ